MLTLDELYKKMLARAVEGKDVTDNKGGRPQDDRMPGPSGRNESCLARQRTALALKREQGSCAQVLPLGCPASRQGRDFH